MGFCIMQKKYDILYFSFLIIFFKGSSMNKCFSCFKAFSFLAVVVFLSSCISSSADEFDISDALRKENLVDIAIIGSGPAGLCSAMHGSRTRLKTLVFEGDIPGGQLTRTTWVENFPAKWPKVMGPDLIADLRKQAESFGAEFLPETVTKVDFSSWPYAIHTSSGLKLHALTIVLATGVSPSGLGVPGEEEYSNGKGVSHCAICDGPFYRGEEVIVVGGGDSAVEEAIQLAPFAKKITVLVRRFKMRAVPIMQEHMAGYPNIFVKYNTSVQDIYGDGTKITGVTLKDNVTGETYKMPVSGVFLAVGNKPNTELIKGKIALDKHGNVIMRDRTQKTSIPGVFAAGDVEADRGHQAIIAAGAGVQAGIDAVKFLTEKVGLNTKAINKLKKQYFNPDATFDYQTDVVINDIGSMDDFEKELATLAADTKSAMKKLLVVEFYTDSCPSCVKLMGTLKVAAKDYVGKAKFLKVNAVGNNSMAIAKRYDVYKAPTLLVFKNGDLVGRYDDDKVLSRQELSNFIDGYF